MKNTISKILVGVACISAQVAFAAAPSSVTPERMLLQKAIALSGEQLPSDQMNQALTNMMNDYVSTSDPAGRDQRLSQALVSLGVLTDQQASQFDTSLNQASSQYQNHQLTYQAALAAVVADSPKGAQFSEAACSTFAMGMEFSSMAVAGGFFATLAAYADLHNSDPMFSQLSDQHWEEGGLITMGVGAAVAIVTGVIAFGSSCSNSD